MKTDGKVGEQRPKRRTCNQHQIQGNLVQLRDGDYKKAQGMIGVNL